MKANQNFLGQKRGSVHSLPFLTPPSPPAVNVTHLIQATLIPLCKLAVIPQNRIIELKRVLAEIEQRPTDCFSIINRRLIQLIPCQKACLLMMDNPGVNLIDINSEAITNVSGLLSRTIYRKEVTCINNNASK